MKILRLFLSFFLCIAQCLGVVAIVKAAETEGRPWFLDRIQVQPQNFSAYPEQKIVVAILDDGIRTTHKDLHDFIWQNPYEIPGNLVDDDGNGAIDDINGWDVADNNNSIFPPSSRLQEYFHGTHLAGIIVQIAQAAYGPKAVDAISIMPVKCISDNAPDTAVREGYKGIEYAVRAGADIILCAWSVGHISLDEEKILQRAREKGVLIIASAGNFPEEREQFPAAESSVLAVAALDRGNEISSRSNYGTFVDLSAPGVDIVSTSSLSDKVYETREGTSQAAAMTAGAAAVMLVRSPSSSNDKIKACLKNASTLLKYGSTEYVAKQGAGLLNIDASIACLSVDPGKEEKRSHPQGYLPLSVNKTGTTTWTIAPSGTFKGLWFYRPELTDKDVHAIINFYPDDKGRSKPFATFSLADMPERFFIPKTTAQVSIQFNTALQNDDELWIEYRAESIQFRTLYCRDTVHIAEPGNFDDGSGSELYAANSDCKWLITAPKGKVIYFKFTEFDTEPKTDLLYFFNGQGTHETIMAIFSGPDIPPELYTWENQTLVWFVTNGEKQGQGWKAEFAFIDKELAQYPTL